MINKSISLDNIIRVNVAENPTNLTIENVNVIAIFTNEKSQYPIDKYVIYKSINGVAEMWGIESKVYKMINNIFSQSLNITAGQGYVVVFQLEDNVEISATSGSIETQNIIYSKFLTVDSGCIGIKIDNNEVVALRNIDFSGCQDLDGIIQVLNENLIANNIEATAYNVDQEIKIISNSKGGTSKVELEAVDTNKTNIASSRYLNRSGATIVNGTDEIPGTPEIPATAGTLRTQPITAGDFTSVVDGCFAISVDGAEAIQITSIDFSGDTTSTQIANKIQTHLTNIATVATSNNRLTFTSLTTGSNSSVVITASTETGTDLTSATYLDIATATATQGTDEVPEVPTVPATAGTLTTTNINVNNFKTVSKGNFKLTINGTEELIEDLDFRSVATLQDIVNIIQPHTTSSITISSNKLVFTSPTTGASSTVAMADGEDYDNIDLSTLDYFNISKCIVVNGTNQYVGQEKIQDAIIRCKELTFFEGILTTFLPSDDEIENTAETIQTFNKMFFVVKNNLLDLEIFNRIKNKKFTKTRCLYYGGEDYLLFASGYASKLLSVNFNGNNTANNVNNKEIIGLLPDTTIGDTELTILKDMGVDCYCNMRDLGVIQCSGENQWADTVLFINWIQNALQVVGFNTLRNNLRIKQTESGVQVLVDNYKTVLEQAITSGYIAPNKWNGPIYFGNNEDTYKNNILQNGYYIYTEPVANQSQEERRKRIAPPCYIAIKLSGAINEADLTIFMED